MKYFTAIYTLIVFAIIGCDAKNKAPESPELNDISTVSPIAEGIEQAHKTDLLRDYDIVQFDIEKSFGGRPATSSTITASTDGGSIRIDGPGDRSVVYHRGEYSTTGDSTAYARDRFDIFTWQYFFMLPHKLSDPGVNLTSMGTIDMDGIDYPTTLLTFDTGTGDAPDDWYRIHTDPSNGLVRHAGYIVTAGGATPKEAAANAHSITYDNYRNMAGIPISTSWTFSNYNAVTSVVEDSIGYAKLSNINFPEAGAVSFDPVD